MEYEWLSVGLKKKWYFSLFLEEVNFNFTPPFRVQVRSLSLKSMILKNVISIGKGLKDFFEMKIFGAMGLIFVEAIFLK